MFGGPIVRLVRTGLVQNNFVEGNQTGASPSNIILYNFRISFMS